MTETPADDRLYRDMFTGLHADNKCNKGKPSGPIVGPDRCQSEANRDFARKPKSSSSQHKVCSSNRPKSEKLKAAITQYSTPVHNRFQILTCMLDEGQSIVACVQEGNKIKSRVQIRKSHTKRHRQSTTHIDIPSKTENVFTNSDDSHILTLHSPTLENPFPPLSQPDEEHQMLVALIKVKILQHKVEALVDTGAIVSCIDYETLRKCAPLAKVVPITQRLRAANKQAIKTYGIWEGTFEIGPMACTGKFYVCKGISFPIILGNVFLRRAKAIIDYGKMSITFREKQNSIRIAFGVYFNRKNDDVTAVDNIFAHLDVENLYSGPQFIRSKTSLLIPPHTIQWVKVRITPHQIHKDTTFIGNKSLMKFHKLLLGDFILKPEGIKYIQVTNLNAKAKLLTPSFNLAVDEEHEDTFSSFTPTVNSVNTPERSQGTETQIKFNINTKLPPEQYQQAEKLLESYRDVFVSDVSELTVCDYPPVKIDYDENRIEMIDSFFGHNFHSTTDCSNGYWQIQLHPDSRDITAFDTPSGSRMRWKVLSQGLSISPAIYLQAMDHLLTKLKSKKKILRYFDDSHIGSETFEEHVQILKEYLQLLREHSNIKKSTFFQFEVKFLGLKVNGKTVSILDKRMNGIKKLKAPSTKKELRSLIGIFSYNRRFVKNYAQKAVPLVDLLKNDTEFEWTEAQQKSLEILKNELTQSPALRIFNPNAPNRIVCDASRLGLGACYYQMDLNTKK
ncbi:hypothetical protein ONE63_007355 [Megalurothrips usitatus]|uniref:Reverse transcriptase domain-containing protein n=1 Tax=Megalurothrips usitatus TaxID=439358 RepID=A0AAV7XYT2_9NEOP|nr:hypothetical protein ONE63_007355 [Megalurothrips usitatus]